VVLGIGPKQFLSISVSMMPGTTETMPRRPRKPQQQSHSVSQRLQEMILIGRAQQEGEISKGEALWRSSLSPILQK
jgi:hypothetical protein